MSRKIYVSALLTGVCTLTSIWAWTAAAQIQSIERRGDNTQRATPDSAVPQVQIQQPRLDIQGATPDTTGVWYFIRAGDAAAARREFDRLRAAFPRWTPPADLVANIARVEHPRPAAPATQRADVGYGPQLNSLLDAITRQKTAGREPAIAALEGTVARRRDAGTAEQLGWAYFNGQDAVQAQRWFDLAVDWGHQENAREGDVRAVAAQGKWEDAARLTGDSTTLKSILADQAATAARASAQAGDWTAAMSTAAIADRNGLPETTTSLGWIALNANSLDKAEAAFAAGNSEDAVYGALLTLDRMQVAWPEIQQACAVQMKSDRQREACGNALSARALAAYRAEDWNTTVAIDSAMRTLGVAQPGITTLAAWSEYRLGHYAVASRQFDTLYSGGADVADGLVLSSLADGQDAAMAARAAADPKIAAVYRGQERTIALARKKFLLADTLGSGQDEAFNNVAAPEVRVGAAYRDKSGTAGEDALRIASLTAGTTFGAGADRFSLDITDMRVRIGQPAPGAAIGTLQPARLAPVAGDVLYAPVATWQHDVIDSRLSVTAGTTPVGGVVAPLPVGQVQWEQDWKSLIATLTVKAVPVMESLLSMSGLRDPATGRNWGRVVETGPEASATYLINDSWSLYGAVDGESISGHNVKTNTRIGGALSLNYQFKPSGFDYIRVGPSYAYQHYDKNEFFFTYGNGGYYSPNQLHTVGAFIDFQTEEGRRWQIGGRISGGWTSKVEDTALQFPLTATGARVGGARGSEFSTDSTLRASVLLGDYLRLGAYGRYTIAPSGKDRAAGLTLSIPFGPRRGTFSSDLPRFLDRAWP